MVTLEILNATQTRVLDAPDRLLKRIDQELSVFQKEAIFHALYKAKKWDGRKHMFSMATHMFPTGLLTEVQGVISQGGYRYQIRDSRVYPEIQVQPTDDMLHDFSLYPFQVEAIQACLTAKRGILWVATNGGKCLAPDTQVRMFDGSCKAAKDIQVRDTLVGPDNRKRVVVSTCTGTARMYRVQVKHHRDFFECNEDHILTVINVTNGEWQDVSIKDYWAFPSAVRRSFRLIRTEVNTAKTTWVGTKEFTWDTTDVYEIGKYGYEPNPKILSAPLPFRQHYLCGVLDRIKGEQPHVTGKPEHIELLANIARSCGFSASVRLLSDSRPAYHLKYARVILAGHTDLLPRKCRFKPAYVTYPSFEVIPLAEGPYAGFTLKGTDGRFVLGNGYVTHNTEIACGIMKSIPVSTLFVVGNKNLVKQARKRISERLNIPEYKIGRIASGLYDPKRITVALIDSLNTSSPKRKKQIKQLLAGVQLLFADEAHHTRAKSWFSLLQQCQAPYRFGLTGTPYADKTDELALVAAFGPVTYRITNDFLIQNGYSAKPLVHIHSVDEPTLDPDMDYPEAYKHGIIYNAYRNNLIVDLMQSAIAKGMRVLTLVRFIVHGRLLYTLAKARGLEVSFVHGKVAESLIEQKVIDFTNDPPSALIASPIFKEGTDIPAVQEMVIADSGKSMKEVLQKIGRGLRKKKTGDNTINIHDFADTTQKYLARHSLIRLRIYENELFDMVEGQ